MELKSEILSADTTHNKINSDSQPAVCVVGDDKNNEIECFPSKRRKSHTDSRSKRFSKDIEI